MAANRKRITRTFHSVCVETRDGDVYEAAGKREDAGKALKLVNRQNRTELDIEDVARILDVEETIELPARVFEMYGSLVRRDVNSIYERESQ